MADVGHTIAVFGILVSALLAVVGFLFGMIWRKTGASERAIQAVKEKIADTEKALTAKLETTAKELGAKLETKVDEIDCSGRRGDCRQFQNEAVRVPLCAALNGLEKTVKMGFAQQVRIAKNLWNALNQHQHEPGGAVIRRDVEA